LLGNYDIQGESFPLITPELKSNSIFIILFTILFNILSLISYFAIIKNIEIAGQFQYSRGILPLENPLKKIPYKEILSCFRNKIFKGNSSP